MKKPIYLKHAPDITKLEYLKLVHGANLTHSEVRVLLAIFNYSDPDGTNAHPGLNRLIKDCRMSMSNVCKCLNSLKKKGWIWEVSKGKRAKEGIEASVYDLRKPDLSPLREDIDISTESRTPDHISKAVKEPFEDRSKPSARGAEAHASGLSPEDTSTDDRVIKDQQPLLKTEKTYVPPNVCSECQCLLLEEDHSPGCKKDPWQ